MRYLTIRAAHSDSIIAGGNPIEFQSSNPLRLFIIQAVIIIIVTRILGVLLSKLKQPRVIAEVIGGILLGPTAIGRIPGFTNNIFPPVSLPYLNLVATLGLVLFLFLVGLEVDVRIIRKCAKESIAISLVGMVLPFGLGAAVSVGIYRAFINQAQVSFGHFLLFSGVAMSITAFPVLARILTETKLLYTKVGVIVLAAGVGNDVVGWILLALTVALVNASTGLTALYVLLCTVGWALFLFFLVKPAFVWLARRTGSFENGPSQFMIMVTLLLVLVSAWVTDIIGVHPIFGSFLVGLMVPHDGGFAIALTEKMEDLVSVIFLPIYFALSGLKTNLGDLNSGKAWAYSIAIIVIAFFSKFVGCAFTARAFGFNLRESAAIGTLMSCKGLVELIVLNVGLSAGILDTRVFSMFVLMAVVSTLITTPLTLIIYPESHRTTLEDGALHSHHGKSHHDREDQGHDADDVGFSGKRLLVILSSFEHLPGLMTLVQVMQPSLSLADRIAPTPVSESGLRKRNQARSPSTDNEKADDSSQSESSIREANGETKDDVQGTPILSSNAPFASVVADRKSAAISIDALRLVELTDRTSAVMKVAESEDTLRADPVINVFSNFAQLNGVSVSASMAVIPQDEYANTVTNRCRMMGSNFILLPMTLSQPSDSPPTNTALAYPFESIFGTRTAQTDSFQKHPQHFNFVRRIIQTAQTDIGLLIDRQVQQQQVSPISRAVRRHHILLSFMGGPDDRAALDFISRLCSSNKALTAIILHFKRVSAEDAEEAPLPTIPPTVHHEVSLQHPTVRSANNMDTMYPSHHGQTSLEATLQDDVAIKMVEDEIATGRFGDRVRIHNVSTARPLRDLIKAVEAEQPAIVLVGRGRRQPTITHREELRFLLHHGLESSSATNNNATSDEPTSNNQEKDKTINSETCKVIGEPAMALTFASTSASTLVIAAGFHVSQQDV